MYVDEAFGFINCSKVYETAAGPKIILDSADFVINKAMKVGLLAPQGSGKSTIVRILAGLEIPDSGTVLAARGEACILGNPGALNALLTAEENVRSIAHLVGLDADELCLWCYEFTGLGVDFFHRLSGYSSGMKASLAYAISLSLPAKMYLADERLVVGDEISRLKCEVALEQVLESRGLVCVTRNPRVVEKVCDHFGVVVHGKIKFFENFSIAKEIFEEISDLGGEDSLGDDALNIYIP